MDRKPKHFLCYPRCYPKHVEKISTESGNRFGSVPIFVTYQCQSGCKPKRGARQHNDPDPKRHDFFEQYDLGKLREIDTKPIPHWHPPHKMMNVEDDSKPWGAGWREGRNFRTVADLFTKRNLWALATLKAGIEQMAEGVVK